MNPNEQQPWQQNQPPSPPVPPAQSPQPATPQVPQQYVPAPPNQQPQQTVENQYAQPLQTPSQYPPTENTTPQQPNQTPAQGSSIDYLNQIAPPVKTSKSPNKLILIIAILLGLLVVVGIISLILGSQPSGADKVATLNARMQTLQNLSKKQHKELRDNNLRATNTSYTLFLTNGITDLSAAAASDKKNNTKEVLAANEKAYGTKLTEKFEDARLNVMLDRVYSQQMAYELSVLRSMMKEAYSSNSNQTLRENLEKADENLTPISKSFKEFSDSNN